MNKLDYFKKAVDWIAMMAFSLVGTAYGFGYAYIEKPFKSLVLFGLVLIIFHIMEKEK